MHIYQFFWDDGSTGLYGPTTRESIDLLVWDLETISVKYTGGELIAVEELA